MSIETAAQQIMIVEDEPKLGQLLVDYLQVAGYSTLLLTNGDQVVPAVKQQRPALILLDLMLPGRDGLTVCRELRYFSDVPVIMVTAKTEEIDRLLGLEIGADDYICKPYSPREVVARVKTILRRCNQAQDIVQGEVLLQIDEARFQARYQGHILDLTPFHAGLMMIPMVLGNMGMKRIVVRVVNRFGYRRVLISSTLMLSVISLGFLLVALMGWLLLIPLVLFVQGVVNALRFSAMNTLTLKDLPDKLASSGNSLLSMVMQLSMSLGVSIAGLLLGTVAQPHLVAANGGMHSTFIVLYCCMALIIALPALVFNRVPADTETNRVLNRGSTGAK